MESSGNGDSDSSGEGKRLVISFDDEDDVAAETGVLEVEPDPPTSRRIIVDDEEYDDEYEDAEFDEEPADETVPVEPKQPGRARELLDRIGLPGRQLALLATAAVVGCLLVSLATVVVVTKWTPLLPEPEIGMVGKKGDEGLPGKRGYRGHRGKRGHTGPRGDPGPIGPEGSNGQVIQGRY